MAKKDFSSINNNPVYDSIATATDEQQAEQDYLLPKTKEALKEAKAKGKKETKELRINMAFDPDNYEYIRILARVTGKTLTDFVNDIVTKSRLEPENQELLEQAKNILSKFNA